MPKILFLCVHRPNRSPSQRYRFEQYLAFLNENGLKYEQFFILNEKDDKTLYSKGKWFSKFLIVLKAIFKLFKKKKHAKDYDFIFVQRECFMLGTSFFEKQFSKTKAKLIFDFDDSIWLLDVSNANKALGWLKSTKKTAKIISYSSTVIAGNSYLADYALKYNSNVIVIPTTVDTGLFKRTNNKPITDKICIGWSGSLTTIKHFELAVPVLKKLKAKYGDKLYIKVMGDKNYVNAELGINGVEWSSETEVKELSELDIGIMPLPDNEWSKGKCGLKGLLYMSLEIPSVMSAVGVNTSIISDGENGFLAASEEEWISKLSLLIESKELREKMGAVGRKTVIEKYSVEANKQKYLSVFKN